MYAEITFNNPICQRLNKILDHLEMNYEINYTDKDGQHQMTSEEAVRKVAAELSDNDDVAILAGMLGLRVCD